VNKFYTSLDLYNTVNKHAADGGVTPSEFQNKRAKLGVSNEKYIIARVHHPLT
jgi:hypothetical protein